METRYLVGDVTGVTAGLSVHIWGQQTETSVALHSGHPLEVGDRVYIAEIRAGIWMCLGPIETAVDYFPIAPEEDPEDDPPPLVVTAGTVTDDGDNIDLNDGTRCPYGGAKPNPNDRKVTTLTVDGTCFEVPDTDGIAPPVRFTGTYRGRVYITLQSNPNDAISTAEVGQVVSANTSTLTDQNDRPLTNPTFQWFVGSAAIIGATSSTLRLTNAHLGMLTVQVSETVGRTDYGPLESPTVTVSADTGPIPPPDTPTVGTVSISGDTRPGSVVTATVTGLVDPEGISNPRPTYQWIVAGNIPQSEERFTIPAGTPAGTLITLTVTVTCLLYTSDAADE